MKPAADAAGALVEQQLWLQRAITGSHATLTDEAAAERVRPSSRMSARERVGVYRDAYFARLLECLADDYPALRALLGQQRFARLCRDYVRAHPPREASLNHYGAALVEFCSRAPASDAVDAAPGAADAGLLRDIARIDWASVELIHAPSAVPLAAAELVSQQASFAQARLIPVPTLRLLQLEHPAHELYGALRSGRGPDAAWPAAATSFVLLQRVHWEIRRVPLCPPEGALLADLLAGTPVTAALDRAADRGASEQDIGAYFQRWLGAGFFAALET